MKCKNKQCCCKCQHRFRLYSHPVVDGKKMSNFLNFVCDLFTKIYKTDKLILNNEHGVCECFEKGVKNESRNNKL